MSEPNEYQERNPKDISEALGVPFPKESHRTRPMGRGEATYVEGHTVIHRLIDATDNRWNFTVDKIERTEIDAQNTMVLAFVTLEIPGLGTRSHIGVQAVNARGGEDLVKGAVTDALKKAATLFGVGLELYGPDYEAGVIAEPAHLPARTRTTSENTIPVTGATVAQSDPGIVSWSVFWKYVEAAGHPRDKSALEKLMGTTLGANPAYALERFEAWRKDVAEAEQGALV